MFINFFTLEYALFKLKELRTINLNAFLKLRHTFFSYKTISIVREKNLVLITCFTFRFITNIISFSKDYLQ